MLKPDTKFLVVEDNDLDVEKITRGFRRLNIPNQIVSAPNGYAALDILRGENGRPRLEMPYIIVLDLNMPRMNGLEFLDELRRDPDISHAPVFVLTTSDRQSDVAAAYRFNVCGYIVKPIEMTAMSNALSTLCSYWQLSKFPDEIKHP